MRDLRTVDRGAPEPPQRPDGRRPWRRRLRLVGLLALLLAILSAVGDRGVIRLYQLVRTRGDLSREINRLKEVNGQLAEEVRSLREDPSRIEEMARDELGLVRPGDTVYDFRGSREATGGRP